MGFTFQIGNACAEHRVDHDDDGKTNLLAWWSAAAMEHDNAPAFRHEPSHLIKISIFEFSYLGWTEFCERTGLKPTFEDPGTGLFRPGSQDDTHGCQPIEVRHLQDVRAALGRLRASTKLPPGYHAASIWVEGMEAPVDPDSGLKYVLDGDTWRHPEPKNDQDLADLIKIAWWMEWAVENCETPAVEYFF